MLHPDLTEDMKLFLLRSTHPVMDLRGGTKAQVKFDDWLTDQVIRAARKD